MVWIFNLHRSAVTSFIPQISKTNVELPRTVLAVGAKIIKGAILGLAIFPRLGLLIKAGLKSSRGRKTTFDRISELRPEKKETKAFLERMFAYHQEFAGLKLLE